MMDTITMAGHQSFPLFLLIGPSCSGKTKWMEKSQHAFLKKIPETSTDYSSLSFSSLPSYMKHDYCKWWLTDTSIFLEIPGDWLFYEKQELFQFIIKYLTQHDSFFSISGILLFFSTESLLPLSFQNMQKDLLKLDEALRFIRQSINQTLIQYTIITHLDHLKGFASFFSELKADERKKLLGLSFSEKMVVLNIYIIL